MIPRPFPALAHALFEPSPRRPLRMLALVLLLALPAATGQDDPRPDGAAPGRAAPSATAPAGPDGDGRAAAEDGAEAGDDAAGAGAGPSRPATAESETPSAGSDDEGTSGEATEAEATREDAIDEAGDDAADVEGTGDEAPRAEADDVAAAGATGAEAAALDLALHAGVLTASRGDEALWTLALPPAGGPVAGPIAEGDAVHVAHGLYLLEVDAADGTVRRRAVLPAPARELVAADREGVRVVVDAPPVGPEAPADEDDGERPAGAVVVVTDEHVAGPVEGRPDAYGWLEAAARAADDPAAAAERDPTQPWLAYLAAGGAADDAARESWWDRALEAARAAPFFEAARLALALDRDGAPDRAEAAMEAALEDFARRGYDPRLLTDADLREAYGFPLGTMRDAVGRGELDAAERWAPFVWRLAAEEAPETLEGLRELAAALRAEGDREAADLWRERAAVLDRAGTSTWIDGAALSLGRTGTWGVVALLAAFALAWLVLLAKVWRAQSLARRQRRERAEPTRPWTRLWVPRHASTTEKASLILLLVAAAFVTTLAGWAERADEVPPAFRTGSLAGLEARRALAALPDTPWAEVARGVSLHVRGETDAAAEAYRAAGDRAPALVNLSLLTEDEELLEAALRADPRDPVARHHLGRGEPPSPFHEAYGEGPLLAVPTPLEFALAAGGDWRATTTRTAVAPWRALPEARPDATPVWAWWAILIAAALLLLALVLSLFVPRPRASREAPRTFAYHVLALLVPGSGHLDELWGLLLLVPWALLGADALAAWRTGEGGFGIPLRAELWILAGLYLANLAGFVVESLSYRRRMRLLREEKPELARSYGVPARPARRET